MKTEGFGSLLAVICNFYVTYPSLTLPAELCAYYKMQNKGFPVFLLMFVAGIVLIQVAMDLVLILEGLTFYEIRFLVLYQTCSDLILLSACRYMFYAIRSLRDPQSKHDFALNSAIRTRFLLCGLIPTAIYMISPLFIVRSFRLCEISEVSWTVFLVSQLNFAAWSIGGVWYKVGLMAGFNIVCCGLTCLRGCFTSLIIVRCLAPVAISAILFVVLDKYTKEKFLLKRALKLQRNLYQNFLEQIQDPVLILAGDRLLFHNRAAVSRLGICQDNFRGRCSRLRSQTGASLDEEIRLRLGGHITENAAPRIVRQERYYMDQCPRRKESEEEVKTSDTFSSAAKDSLLHPPGPTQRRVLEVSVVESAEMAVSESASRGPGRAVSVLLHDITDELRMHEKRVESKYKNMLLFSLSHELKTPLNIFQAFLNESKKLVVTEEMKQLFRQAKGAWRYLRNKINDILDYAQILSSDFALHSGEFSLKRFLNYLHKTTLFLLIGERQKNVDLNFRVDERIPEFFYADRDRLEQVLFNLLSNAARFTEKGSISVEVSLCPQEQPRQRTINFVVRDTGCGMSKERVDTLFTLSRESSGRNVGTLFSPRTCPYPVPSLKSAKATPLSGLGLTITRMICNKFGSDIKVSSQLGVGSTFSFELIEDSPPSPPAGKIPVSNFGRASDLSANAPKQEYRRCETQCMESDGNDDQIPDEAPAINRIRFIGRQTYRRGMHRKSLSHSFAVKIPQKIRSSRGHHIALVVDDNDFNRYVAEQMLKKCGFQKTFTAENGKVAIERLRQIQAENSAPSQTKIFVFMDVEMPVMDGIEATTQIRRENARPRPAIVALTAYSAESERKKCFAAGMDFFVDKPLTKERLYELMRGIEADTRLFTQ